MTELDRVCEQKYAVAYLWRKSWNVSSIRLV
jgi:hypothetical protein